MSEAEIVGGRFCEREVSIVQIMSVDTVSQGVWSLCSSLTVGPEMLWKKYPNVTKHPI
jgi:hypothetical protein